MNCSKFKKRISLFYDDRLDKLENQAIEEHLALCPACSEEFRQFSLACRLASALPQQSPATDGWDNLQSQLLFSRTRSLRARRPAFLLAFTGGVALLLFLAALGLFWTSQPGVDLVEDKPASMEEHKQQSHYSSIKAGPKKTANPQKTAGLPADSAKVDNTSPNINSSPSRPAAPRKAGETKSVGSQGGLVAKNQVEHQPSGPPFDEPPVSLEPDPEFSEPEALAINSEADLLDLIDEGLEPLVSAASLYSDPLDWLMVFNDQEWL